ncbi:MAG: GHKL domain-containing protein [Gemmatimonadetes bacterium]|nr:MAG: GHKL domain-containing protein [Gemmatimonadota bacterium]
MTDPIQHLEQKLETVTREAERVDLLNDLTKAWATRSIDKAAMYAQKALELAEQINYPFGFAVALYRGGAVSFYQGYATKTIQQCQRACEMFKELGEAELMIESLQYTGNGYMELGDHEKALDYLIQALRAAEELGDKSIIAKCLNTLGNFYNEIRQRERGMKYHQQALQLYQEIGDHDGIAVAQTNLGIGYTQCEQYDQAVEAFTTALHYYEEMGQTLRAAQVMNNLGFLYKRQEQWDTALEYFNRSLDIKTQHHDQRGMIHSLMNKSEILNNLGQPETALENQLTALRLAEELSLKSMIANINYNIAHTYTMLGDHKTAYQSLLKYVELNRELTSEDMRKKLAEMETQNELERKERETELYRLKNVELARLNEELEKTNQSLIETQLKLVESQAQRIQAEKLATLGELAGVIAHEVNNALSGIMVPNEIILNTPELDRDKIWQCWESDEDGSLLEAYLDQREKEFRRVKSAADMIRTAAKRAAHVVDDLQNLIGGRSRQLGPVNLCQVFRSACRLQKQRLERITIIEEFECDPLEIVITSGEVGQIFMHLLVNASDALQEQKSAIITVRMYRQANGVQIECADNGRGIPPDHLEHLFDPFFSTKTRDGSGLGLTAVKRIIEEYGGSIDVQSEIGVGTTFSVWLPTDHKGKGRVFHL